VRLTPRARRGRGAVPLALALAAACANTGEPPGGPPDEKPPVILAVYPESGAVLPNPRGDAVIQFDGVIDEQGGGGSGPGVSGLASRFLLSPTAGPVNVSWHRSAVHLKPREGWKPGRIYQIQILPGISDLRRNVTKERRTIVFSTGPVIPHASLSGFAVLWVEQRGLVGGLIRAQLLPDTLAYLAVVDSSGGFRLDNLPPGRYAVSAIADQNGNRQRDRREAYDSTLVTLDSSAAAVLFAFVHDTTGPRLRQADPLDSVAARLTFTQPLDPALAPESVRVRVVTLPDSAPVRVRTLLTQATYDSLAARERAVLDSLRTAHDTTRKPAPPPRDTTRIDTLARPPQVGARPAAADTSAQHLILQQRPVPQDKLVLRFDTTLTPGARYFVEVRGVRNLSGVTGDGHSVLVVPKPKPAPDRPDSTRAPRDSTKP
jgi:Big-like domain-containing protein